jgi:hypothetical protein
MGMAVGGMGGAAVIDWNHGHLKIHPIEAHLTHHAGMAFERMSPFIFMRVG